MTRIVTLGLLRFLGAACLVGMCYAFACALPNFIGPYLDSLVVAAGTHK